MDGTSSASLAASTEFLDEQVGTEPGRAGEVSEGLYAVVELLDREPSLRRAFTDPASSPDSRRGLAHALLENQLAAAPLEIFDDLVARRWGGAADLRTAVESLATAAAMRGAEGEGVLDEVEDELFRFGRALDAQTELRQALTDRGLPEENKLGLLHALLEGAQPTTVRLLELAVTRRRAGSIEHRIDELTELAAARRERYVAQVRVARPLEGDQAERLARSLARIYGREVALQVDVDPSVLGGVEVRVGDEVVNGTIARRLGDATRRLAG